MSIRKRLAVGAATGVLGLVLGTTVLSPVVAGAQESTTATTGEESAGPAGVVEDSRRDRLREGLEDLVTDGILTAAQADAVAEHLVQFDRVLWQGRGLGHGLMIKRHIVISLGIAADAIGIERSALIGSIEDGQTIAEVADANGSNAAAVIDALLTANQAKLDELLAEGSITAEQAAERATGAVDRITDLVNGDYELRARFEPRFDAP